MELTCNGLKMNKIGNSIKDVTVVATKGQYLHRANPFTKIWERGVYPIFKSVRQTLSFKERMKIAEDIFVSNSL